MSKMVHKHMSNFIKYMKETIFNKIIAIIILVVASVPVWLDRDITALVLISIFAIPLFFAKNNWIFMEDDQ